MQTNRNTECFSYSCKHDKAKEEWCCWSCQVEQISPQHASQSPIYMMQVVKDRKLWLVGIQSVVWHVFLPSQGKNSWLWSPNLTQRNSWKAVWSRLIINLLLHVHSCPVLGNICCTVTNSPFIVSLKCQKKKQKKRKTDFHMLDSVCHNRVSLCNFINVLIRWLWVESP